MFGIKSTWIALALVVAAVAAPPALAESPLAAKTEAAGYAAIARYQAQRSAHSDIAALAAKTEAAGYAGITRYHVQHASQSAAAAVAAREEAEGLRALARFWEQHGVSTVTVSSPSGGFAWGDAAIGAALTIGVFLVGAAAALAVRRRQGPARLRS
jgi:hypothetical protein